MKLLFTGANGFLGKNLINLLIENEFVITTLDLSFADIICDLSKSTVDFSQVFDVVVHAAGKAHVVPKSAKEKQLFFDINLAGTKNLCAALEKSGVPKSFIFISTVAVYGCESGENITEEHPLNGDTPYALSKIQAERYLTKWSLKNNVILTIFRPSLIAGKNPPGNLGSIIKGMKTNRYLSIKRNNARKSVLMAEDIATLISLSLPIGGIYNICDDHHPSFNELELLIIEQLQIKKTVSIPYGIAKFLAKIGDVIGSKAPINSFKLRKITETLTFSNEKAKNILNWHPTDVLNNFKIS